MSPLPLGSGWVRGKSDQPVISRTILTVLGSTEAPLASSCVASLIITPSNVIAGMVSPREPSRGLRRIGVFNLSEQPPSGGSSRGTGRWYGSHINSCAQRHIRFWHDACKQIGRTVHMVPIGNSMASFHILVPTDFSNCSEAALQYAVKLARVREHGKVTLLHVEPGVVPLFDEQLGTLEPNRLMNRIKLLEAERALGTDMPIEDHLMYGDPPGKIVEAAKDLQADLIVMGTHGRTGLNRALVGSTAESVLRSAPCPVILVKSVSSSCAGNATDPGVSHPSPTPDGNG